jgi:hypothetical protein
MTPNQDMKIAEATNRTKKIRTVSLRRGDGSGASLISIMMKDLMRLGNPAGFFT